MLYYLLLCEALKDQSNIVPMAALRLLLWQQLAKYTTTIIFWGALLPYYCICNLIRTGGALANPNDRQLNGIHDQHLVILFPQ